MIWLDNKTSSWKNVQRADYEKSLMIRLEHSSEGNEFFRMRMKGYNPGGKVNLKRRAYDKREQGSIVEN